MTTEISVIHGGYIAKYVFITKEMKLLDTGYNLNDNELISRDGFLPNKRTYRRQQYQVRAYGLLLAFCN